MTHHVAPPGDWEPPEPHWVKRVDQIAETIRLQVNRHVRVYRRGWWIWMCAGLTGYWIGFISVEVAKWLAGIK